MARNEIRERRRSTDRPSPLRHPLLLVALALAAGFGAARWLEQRQSFVWTGRLRAIEVVVRSPESGRLQELKSATGAIVENGRPLATLVDEASDRRRQSLQQSVAILEQELSQSKARAEIDLAWRINTIETERHEARLKQAAYLQQKLDNELREKSLSERLGVPSESDDAPMASLRPVRFEAAERIEKDADRISLRLQREAAANAVEVAGAQISLCDKRLAQLDRLAEVLPAKAQNAQGVEAILSRLDSARKELESEKASSNVVTIAATEYGTVGRWAKRPGDQVIQGEPLVTLFDEDRRYIELPIPSQRLGEFAEGAKVSLLFPGNVKRKGVVGPLPRQTNDASAESVIPPESGGVVTIRIDSVDRLWPESPIGTSIAVRVVR